ncbi:hypothetical protein RKD49_007808 [Streptomyces glaucescens]
MNCVAAHAGGQWRVGAAALVEGGAEGEAGEVAVGGADTGGGGAGASTAPRAVALTAAAMRWLIMPGATRKCLVPHAGQSPGAMGRAKVEPRWCPEILPIAGPAGGEGPHHWDRGSLGEEVGRAEVAQGLADFPVHRLGDGIQPRKTGIPVSASKAVPRVSISCISEPLSSCAGGGNGLVSGCGDETGPLLVGVVVPLITPAPGGAHCSQFCARREHSGGATGQASLVRTRNVYTQGACLQLRPRALYQGSEL